MTCIKTCSGMQGVRRYACFDARWTIRWRCAAVGQPNGERSDRRRGESAAARFARVDGRRRPPRPRAQSSTARAAIECRHLEGRRNHRGPEAESAVDVDQRELTDLFAWPALLVE